MPVGCVACFGAPLRHCTPIAKPIPIKRAHKHERMQELLRARKDGDVLTMLGLYAEASGDEELALAETEMKQACELMQQKLDRLQHERTEIAGQSPLHAWAHQEFYRISRKQREQKIKRWEREARAEARDVTRIADELKNLKVLKAHLGRRREQKYEELKDLDVKMVDPTHLVNAQHGQFRIGRFELVEGRQGIEMQVNFGSVRRRIHITGWKARHDARAEAASGLAGPALVQQRP